MVWDLLAKENEVFLPTLRAVGAYPDGNLKIAQDNCSIHRARVVQEWFQEKRIQQLDWWSAMSPDFNPIENLWGRIVRNWDGENERTKPQLHEHVMKQWERYRGEGPYFENLGLSVYQRIQMAREANGGGIKY